MILSVGQTQPVRVRQMKWRSTLWSRYDIVLHAMFVLTALSRSVPSTRICVIIRPAVHPAASRPSRRKCYQISCASIRRSCRRTPASIIFNTSCPLASAGSCPDRVGARRARHSLDRRFSSGDSRRRRLAHDRWLAVARRSHGRCPPSHLPLSLALSPGFHLRLVCSRWVIHFVCRYHPHRSVVGL